MFLPHPLVEGGAVFALSGLVEVNVLAEHVPSDLIVSVVSTLPVLPQIEEHLIPNLAELDGEDASAAFALVEFDIVYLDEDCVRSVASSEAKFGG